MSNIWRVYRVPSLRPTPPGSAPQHGQWKHLPATSNTQGATSPLVHLGRTRSSRGSSFPNGRRPRAGSARARSVDAPNVGLYPAAEHVSCREKISSMALPTNAELGCELASSPASSGYRLREPGRLARIGQMILHMHTGHCPLLASLVCPSPRDQPPATTRRHNRQLAPQMSGKS